MSSLQLLILHYSIWTNLNPFSLNFTNVFKIYGSTSGSSPLNGKKNYLLSRKKEGGYKKKLTFVQLRSKERTYGHFTLYHFCHQPGGIAESIRLAHRLLRTDRSFAWYFSFHYWIDYCSFWNVPSGARHLHCGRFRGEPTIVLGAVVGSNITNIALVLGLVAVVAKTIKLEYNIWHIDMPYLWGSAFFLWFIVRDLQVTFFEALICMVGIITFMAYSMKTSDEPIENRPKVNWRHYTMLGIGGALVWVSSDFAIQSIEEISLIAGISPSIISVSAVALGTSLPEVIVSLNAARKGKASIAVGNVLGSNIFNTYVVVGIPSLMGKVVVSGEILDTFIPIMLVMTILFGIMTNNKTITRWEGVVLLMFYMLYTSQLFTGTNL
jgi:cation:H+ antiporter